MALKRERALEEQAEKENILIHIQVNLSGTKRALTFLWGEALCELDILFCISLLGKNSDL